MKANVPQPPPPPAAGRIAMQAAAAESVEEEVFTLSDDDILESHDISPRRSRDKQLQRLRALKNSN